MSEFKKGDEVILVPPVELRSEYIAWVGRFARILEKEGKKNGATWYKIEVSGGEITSAKEDWLKVSMPICSRSA